MEHQLELSIEMTPEFGELAEALANARKSFKPVKKTIEVSYQTKAGKKSYKYATLENLHEATIPALSENGLFVIQSIGDGIICTAIIHKSSQSIKTYCPIPRLISNIQDHGSNITYGKRYSYAATLCIQAEDDDDGEISSNNQKAFPAQVLISPHQYDFLIANAETCYPGLNIEEFKQKIKSWPFDKADAYVVKMREMIEAMEAEKKLEVVNEFFGEENAA